MKKYIKPTIKVKTLNADSNFLAASTASTEVGMSDTPAYESASAKQQSFFGMDEDPNATSSKSSVWDE